MPCDSAAQPLPREAVPRGLVYPSSRQTDGAISAVMNII
jgi:hypothetical protein